MRVYTITIYTAGYNKNRDEFVIDAYSYGSVSESLLGGKLDELVASALSDGMAIKNIVITQNGQ
jgi:hypothetical protein